MDTPANSMIEAHSLYRSFGTREAVVGLSFSMRRGETFGLLGPNGAGKTTTSALGGFLGIVSLLFVIPAVFASP